MTEFLTDIWDNHFWAVTALFFATMVALSLLAERRRSRRIKIENVGFMPWTSITLFGVLMTVISIALAIKLP